MLTEIYIEVLLVDETHTSIDIASNSDHHEMVATIHTGERSYPGNR